jgi:hypothetical protein
VLYADFEYRLEREFTSIKPLEPCVFLHVASGRQLAASDDAAHLI